MIFDSYVSYVSHYQRVSHARNPTDWPGPGRWILNTQNSCSWVAGTGWHIEFLSETQLRNSSGQWTHVVFSMAFLSLSLTFNICLIIRWYHRTNHHLGDSEKRQKTRTTKTSRTSRGCTSEPPLAPWRFRSSMLGADDVGETLGEARDAQRKRQI